MTKWTYWQLNISSRPDFGSPKSKIMQKKNLHVHMHKVIISNDLLSKYKDVILTVDIMSVNKVLCLGSISWHIKFISMKMIKNQKQAIMVVTLKQTQPIKKISLGRWKIASDK